MKEFTVEVHVTPREGLLDPQANAILGALRSLEFEEVGDVRVGRLIRVRLRARNEQQARERAEAMCRKLLANPVTEDFSVELEGA